MIFESLISRRFLLHSTAVTLVTFIFFVFIYRLENIYDGSFVLKKFVTWNIRQNTTKNVSRVTQSIPSGITQKLPDHMCYKNEPFIVLESCIACSQFEQNAVKAAYCFETGFYDKVNCTRSKRLGLKPCYKKINRSAQFNLFTLFCAFCSVFSYSLVNWRQNVLRKQDYMRIQNQLNA
uniref:Jumping translocation breakpoint protein n=1 Tax=Onchocerca volvulus TaxID=6282 RepID=A0A8R1TQB5_ONCVO